MSYSSGLKCVFVALVLAGAGNSLAAAVESVRADAAMARLLAGNVRFVAGTPEHPHQSAAWRAEIAQRQRPFAVVFTCADSRVAPEIYFDAGLGDLFVLRNAGNVLDDHMLGSIEYAVEHLGVTLVLVVGHAKCGAVAAAVEGGDPAGHLGSIVESIGPAVVRAATAADRLDGTVRAHALLVAEAISKNGPLLNKAVASGHLKVVAARYDLTTGTVAILGEGGSP